LRRGRASGTHIMSALLKLSEITRRFLEWIALASGWLLVIMACVTSFDVLARKAGMQLPFTKLQELEWHFHAAIFSLWMGYCYTINAHPRVDSFTGQLTYRGKAWVELFGCLLLALPYMGLIAYFSLDYVARSYAIGEQSDSTVGLTHRWIIKGVFVFGLWLVVLGILSVLFRVIVFLFGGKSQEEVDLQIGHVEADI
jgi:TRAP-type mannitol/chloroaromatic compound transport system permease small subunit